MRLNFHRLDFRFIFFLSLLMAMMSSCSLFHKTVVTNYPHTKPFVFGNSITLNANTTKDEKIRLIQELNNYWDDSLRVNKIQQFGFLYKIKNPPVFDSANIVRSIGFMNAYLNSQGYYYATFADSVKIDTVKDQLRANIHIIIDAGKNITIDSVSYDMGDSTLQKLTRDAAANTLLKKGAPYTKQVISSELDRLVNIYRQNGFYRFTREDILAEVDSVDTRLLQLTLDPFKQAEIIADAAKARKENPTWDIRVFKVPTFDSSRLRQYYIGRSYYYPETKFSDNIDSLPRQKDFLEINRRNLTMRYKKGLFNYRPLREHTYLKNGDLYNENNYFKSINSLGQLGAWQQVDAKPQIRNRDTLDLYFFLVPAVKQSFTFNQEVSLNTSDIGQTNLWGLSSSISYNNKNVWKSAIQSIATITTGVELNLLTGNQNSTFQTFLVNVSHTYVFPKLIVPFNNWKALNKLDNKRTLFTVSGSYIDRKDYYQLRSLVTSWGYEWKKGNNVWLYKPLNVELYALDTLAGLDTLFKYNPFLRASFNSGKVISQTLLLTKNFTNAKHPNVTHYIRMGVEEAGGLFGLLGGKIRNDIYRYIKVEGEYTQTIKMQKAELAFHAFAGIGYNYGTDTIRDKTLPFFKQFYAGGPNSMRAWGLRQLGLGSSRQSESDTALNTYRDRFGDMRLEANIEYRFPITTVAGFKITSALFTDIGNIWDVRKNAINPDAQFSFKNLARDLAIGVGTGLRIDFNYFLLRFDFAYKLKDPGREYNNGWATTFQWFENRKNGLQINNVAFQLGIGLPF